LIQFYATFRSRARLRDVTGDPWDGRTLEWSTASPPPPYNLAFTPVVHDGDAWSDMKRRGYVRPLSGFRPIHMPRNTGAGVVLAALSATVAIGMIWYIWWLAIVGFAALLAVAVGHSFNYHRAFHIGADTVLAAEGRRTRLLDGGF
jgi:cytochrome o ubiquinol oxidase subunit 1